MISVDSLAWLPKSDFSLQELERIRRQLVLYPIQMRGVPAEGNDPIELFQDTPQYLGIAREFFLERATGARPYEVRASEGDLSTWPGPLQWNPAFTLREEQQRALGAVTSCFSKGGLGGMVRAGCGWGKSLHAASVMHKLQVPTLVIVHKEFLMSQWEERLKEYLPNVQVGFAQQEDCSYLGKHVVIGMVHSLASKDYPKAFWSWPGLVVVDEAHRISARTWSNVPSRIRARHRLGLSATPRRKDGTENVFRYHLGREIFAATEKRMKPLIRRVYTEFRLVRSGSFNPTLAPESLILNFLAQSEDRNNRIVELMLEATTAGRKLLIVSKRLEHLRTLEAKFRRAYHKHHQKVASVGWYVGGMSEDARDDSEGKQVILATAQFASEGLDIPALDTVFLTMPMADIEQVVGRILRPSEGKKSPIVVDFRDDYVPVFAAYSRKREEQYERLI